MWFDGATCVTNPGPTAYGVVVKRDGVTIAEISRTAGAGTSNEAEWDGIIAALREGLMHGDDEVRIYGDSQLIIEQIQGNWAIKKQHLRVKKLRADKVLARYAAAGIKLIISWIPRKQNSEADVLSKRPFARQFADV